MPRATACAIAPTACTEIQPLDFHSPYGCSKGAADQYVRDYARIYGLRTVVFRQSCIYGERQFGVEDQGWVAHFVIAAAYNKPINIYGNGKQVRDLLNVRDLVNVYDRAWDKLDAVSGQAFNIGGGAHNTLAIWSEFGPFLEELSERKIQVTRSDWRARRPARVHQRQHQSQNPAGLGAKSRGPRRHHPTVGVGDEEPTSL